MQPLALAPGAVQNLLVPFNGGLVTNRDPERLALGQLAACENLWQHKGRLIRRPCVKRIGTAGLPTDIYGLYRYFRDGDRYSLVIGPSAATPAALALFVRKNDTEATASTTAFSEEALLFDTATWRIISFAELREVLALADGLNPCRFISDIDPTTLAPVTGRLGYLPPLAAPVIASAAFGSSTDDSPVPHGIYQLACAYIYKDTGEHSNPGPRSNIFDSQYLGRTERGLGVRSLALTSVPTGVALNELMPDGSVSTQDQDRADARAFPGRFKKFGDDLFGPFIARDEKAGLDGATHSSSDPFDGAEATTDNDLPPVCAHLKRTGLDALVAIACKPHSTVKPAQLVDAATDYYEPVPTTKIATITVTNQTGRTVTCLPLKIRITFADLDDYGDNWTGHDFVFTDNDSRTILPYDQDAYSAGNYADFWVLIPELPASGVAVLYLHYDATESFTSLETVWGSIFRKELTNRDDIVHFAMDEAALSPEPLNRRTNNPAIIRDPYLAVTRWASGVDGDPPPYDFDINKAFGLAYESYLYHAHMRTDSPGINATPNAITLSCMVKIATFAGSGALYLCGLSHPLELPQYRDAGVHLCTNNTSLPGDLYLKNEFNAITYATLPLTGTGLLNGHWWFIAAVCEKTDTDTWSITLYAADMETGYSADITDTVNGAVGEQIPFHYESTGFWHTCDSSVDTGLESATHLSTVHAKDLRATLTALSTAELEQLARRKPALASTPSCAVEPLDPPDDDAAARRIQFSRAGDAHSWPYDSEHVIEDAGQGGGFLNGFPFGDGLAAFKQNQLVYFRFDAHRQLWTREESISPRAANLGLAGQHAATLAQLVIENGAVECIAFVSSDSRVWALMPDLSLRDLGEPVQDQIAALAANGRARAVLVHDPLNRLLILGYKSGTFTPAGTGPYGESALVMQCDSFDSFRDDTGDSRAWPQWRTWKEATIGWRIAGAAVYNSPGDLGKLVWFADSATSAGTLYTLDESVNSDDWSAAVQTVPAVLARTGMIPFQEFAALLTARPLYRLDQITAWDALTLAISVRHPVSRATRTVLSAAVASHVRTSLARGSVGDAVQFSLSGSEPDGAFVIHGIEFTARGLAAGQAALLTAFPGGGGS